jgi:hypothetical protein
MNSNIDSLINMADYGETFDPCECPWVLGWNTFLWQHLWALCPMSVNTEIPQ